MNDIELNPILLWLADEDEVQSIKENILLEQAFNTCQAHTEHLTSLTQYSFNSGYISGNRDVIRKCNLKLNQEVKKYIDNAV